MWVKKKDLEGVNLWKIFNIQTLNQLKYTTKLYFEGWKHEKKPMYYYKLSYNAVMHKTVNSKTSTDNCSKKKDVVITIN